MTSRSTLAVADEFRLAPDRLNDRMYIKLVSPVHVVPEPLAVRLVRVALDSRTRRGIHAVLRALEPVAASNGYLDGPDVLRTALAHPDTPLAVEFRPVCSGLPGVFPVVNWRGTRYEVVRGTLCWERLTA